MEAEGWHLVPPKYVKRDTASFLTAAHTTVHHIAAEHTLGGHKYGRRHLIG